MARAVRGIASKAQVPTALAAQSVLAASTLAAQVHADIALPFGQTRPPSLYLLTVARSGDRKSTSDREALWAVNQREADLHADKRAAEQRWAASNAAWAADKRKIEADKNLDREARRLALEELGPEEPPPLQPMLVMPDPTLEGLVKAMPTAPASLGVFSAEGGQLIGGHAMSRDHKLSSAAGSRTYGTGFLSSASGHRTESCCCGVAAFPCI